MGRPPARTVPTISDPTRSSAVGGSNPRIRTSGAAPASSSVWTEDAGPNPSLERRHPALCARADAAAALSDSGAAGISVVSRNDADTRWPLKPGSMSGGQDEQQAGRSLAERPGVTERL